MGCCDNCCVPPKESRDPIRHDPNFNGPIHNRSCTDVIFLIVFILYLGLWGFIGFYSIKHGDVQNLLAPIDSRGRRCGMDSGVQDKPNLLFFDLRKCLSHKTVLTGCPTTQVCVDRCPDQTIQFDTLTTPFENWKSQIVCTEDVDIKNLDRSKFQDYVLAEKCAPFLLKSQPVLFRCVVDPKEICSKFTELPSNACPKGKDAFLNDVTSDHMKHVTTDQLEVIKWSTQIVSDLIAAKWYMLGALGAVVIICFIYILLLRWVVAPVVWSSIIGLLALLGYACYLSYKQYVYYKANPVTLLQTNNLKGFAQSIFSKQETWLVLLIALAVIIVILLLVLIFLRSRISIAIALIREGSKAITAVKSTVFFPILPWILQCAVIGYGVIVIAHLLSIGQPTFKVVNLGMDQGCDCKGAYKDYDTCIPVEFLNQCHNGTSASGIQQPCSQALCHFTGIVQPTEITYMQIGNLLGFFWAMFFVSGVTDMILASTFSTWYWTFHKRDVPFFTLTTGIYRTVRFHLGTVAFGALIIAIVRVIRVILEYIDHKVKKFDNALSRCIMCFCKCFFWCLESFLKFINKNAYIMCAVHGKNFCRSASDAFSLLMRNIVRVVVLDKVADFIFFLSKLLISLGVGAAVYYILEWNLLYEITKGERLNYNYVPAIILSVATYLICTIFFNVYSMAVDTLFLCFLEDCERNDGSPEKPYFMSKNLMKILGKRNRKTKKAED